jgi:hypothetical protein
MENCLINIDSRFRNIQKYPDAGKFTITLPEPLKNITFIRLASIELPTTFYTFLASYNNISFTIILNNDQEISITIKEGCYTSTLMINYIQSLLNVINSTYNTNFSISWDEISYKVTITNNISFSLIFDNDSIHRSLGFRLGFRGNNNTYLYTNQLPVYNEATNTTIYTWTGESFLDVTKDEYLFLRINDYGILYNQNTNMPNTILAKIILYDQQFVIDNGANLLTKTYKFRQPINLSKLDIELVNMLGFTIDMNLIDFSFTLECGQIYDNNDYNNHNFRI